MEDQLREIGGYFELEHFAGSEYHQGALALNCARNCLAYLIEARRIKAVWLPRYLCSSVAAAACKAGAKVKEYEVTEQFLPDYESISLSEGDYLYLVDYYGQLADEDIRAAHARSNGRLIVDEVMAFFRKPIDDFDTLYSCRKFFGVADGAYLYTSARLERNLKTDESYARMDFVLGRTERTANDFYPRSAENNSFFSSEDIKLMSPVTHNILRAVDYDAIAAKRLANYEYVAGRVDAINELAPHATSGAFAYPLLIKDGSKIRISLQQHKLYISTLWPYAASQKGISGRYAQDILPLVIDQRYTLDDMAYECNLLGQIILSQTC